MTAAGTEIIASGLEAAAWEMCASLIRTAYSPNVKERADCSTALVDLQGRTLALATHAPAHLGSTLRLVPAILERFPLDELKPGDAFLANDPYIVGVTHLNDCTLATPIFVDGRPVAFAASVTHHSDVGGRVPGSEAAGSGLGLAIIKAIAERHGAVLSLGESARLGGLAATVRSYVELLL